jgi:hypothetical protein
MPVARTSMTARRGSSSIAQRSRARVGSLVSRLRWLSALHTTWAHAALATSAAIGHTKVPLVPLASITRGALPWRVGAVRSRARRGVAGRSAKAASASA